MTIPRIAAYPLPQPEQWPSRRMDWQPDRARSALLVHDLQDYFLDFYDRAAAPIPQLLAHVRALRDACDRAGVPVLYTAQPPQQSVSQRGLLQPWWGPGITAQPARAGIAAEVAPRDHDTVLEKWRYSAFVHSDLQQRLQALGRDQLVVCGVYAHIGCLMTVADAFMRDVQPFLVADAVADFSAADHAMALDYVASRCGVVIGHAACVQALAGGIPDSLQALRAELARILELPLEQVGERDNPLHLGLDSVRLMLLLERWSAGGARVGFVELGECDSVAAWWSLLDSRRVPA